MPLLKQLRWLFSAYRNGFTSGELSIARLGTKLTLTVGKGSSAMEFDLFEAKAAERKAELQTVLFRLAEQTCTLEAKLSAANQSLEKLRAQNTNASGMSTFLDPGSKKVGGQGKAKPRKIGMSVVNPASRKRKAATGVVFDWNIIVFLPSYLKVTVKTRHLVLSWEVG